MQVAPRVSNAVIHLVIWTRLNTSLVKVTLSINLERSGGVCVIRSLASIRVATPMAGSSGDGSP